MSLRRNAIVGLTGILGLFGLAAMLVLFGELTWAEPPRYNITLKLNSAQDLQPGSAVTLNGVQIGQITETRTAPDPRQGVRLVLAIDEQQQIPRAVDVVVNRDFVGSTRLALVTLPTGEGPDGFVEPGGELEGRAEGLLEQVGTLLDERIGPFGDAAESVKRLADTYSEVGQRLNMMLDPNTADPSIPTASGDVNLFRTVAKLEAAVDEARLWLGDEELRAQFGDSVAQAEQTLAEVEEAAIDFRNATRRLEQEARAVGANADEAARAFVSATNTLEETLNSVQLFLDDARTGDGTVSMLLNNPDVYRNINNASVRLEQMLREAKLLMEKYRTEGIDIDF